MLAPTLEESAILDYPSEHSHLIQSWELSVDNSCFSVPTPEEVVTPLVKLNCQITLMQGKGGKIGPLDWLPLLLWQMT